MFGIPIDGPTMVYGDNGAVISNSSIRTSTSTKKHNAICYHRVREAVAAGRTAIGKVHTDYNLADLLPSSCLLKEDTTSCSVLPTKLNGRRSQHESARSLDACSRKWHFLGSHGRSRLRKSPVFVSPRSFHGYGFVVAYFIEWRRGIC